MYTDAAHTISATLLPDGARHLVVPGVYLGTSIDTSSDATISATGDPDDDGVVFQDGTNLISEPTGQTAAVKTITVTASVAGVLDAWIDWNGDGVWEPSSEAGDVDRRQRQPAALVRPDRRRGERPGRGQHLVLHRADGA